jgi:ribosomal protein S18 acetylase RimI-like enzyme
LIRRVAAGDAALLRDIRLRALRSDPASFGSTYERELAFDPDRWVEWAYEDSRGDTYTTLLALDDEEALGIVTAARDQDDPTLYHVYAMWVAPEARRRGLGRRLLEELETWVRASGGQTSQLSVTSSAAAAKRLYESAGYVPDGQIEESRHTPGLLHVSLRKQLTD